MNRTPDTRIFSPLLYLARIYEIQPLACPRCQGPMRLIAFLTEPPSIRTILAHLGEPTTPPVLAPRARAPPEFDAGLAFDFDQLTPACSSFDQTRN